MLKLLYASVCFTVAMTKHAEPQDVASARPLRFSSVV